ncbi:hypothetical protein F5B20DRAFT_579799 [Whalleya microplaca]|nr:hypothetical protein F5B20DRAFT_579799 [Whalleya microplaca]
MTPRSHDSLVMNPGDYGYPLGTAEQHLRSNGSRGYYSSGPCTPYRRHPGSHRSVRSEQCQKENDREYAEWHSLSPPKLRFNAHRVSSYCQTCRTAEDCPHRPPRSVSASPSERPSPEFCWEHNSQDDVISTWLSGVPPCSVYSSKGIGIDTETRVEEPSARRHELTIQSETGFDGPLSSRDGENYLTPEGRSCELGSSIRRSRLSGSSRGLRSDESGSIDWEKCWPKRRPRRVHDVSEASNTDPVPQSYTTDIFSMVKDQDDSDSETHAEEKSCSHVTKHDTRFHAIHHIAFNSCPELHHQLEFAGEPPPGYSAHGGQDCVPQLRLKLDEGRYRHHGHVRDKLSKRFRSFGRRLRRSSSSSYSIRSDFPAPLDGKERRIRARCSADVWLSSGEESPIFNTPESNAGSACSPSHHIDPLAIAGVMIATAELDRLSSPGSIGQTSRTSASSSGVLGISPMLPTPFSSSIGSPNNGTSTSDLAELDTSPPTMPFNTPSSSVPQSGLVSPVHRSSLRQRQRRRAHRSRLSEVTTPENESVDDLVEGQRSFTPPAIETLQECLANSMGVNQDTLIPQPLSINRSRRAETECPKINRPDDSAVSHSMPELNAPSPVRANIPYMTTRSSTKLSDNLSPDTPFPPSRSSSIGKTPEPMYGPRKTSTNADDQGLLSPNVPPNTEHSATPAGMHRRLSGDLRRVIGRAAADDEIHDIGDYVNARLQREGFGPPAIDPAESADAQPKPESCHPDTWSESRGEPGNSDPFCPPDCLVTRHSSQDSGHVAPLALIRRSTSGTVHQLGEPEAESADSDDQGQPQTDDGWSGNEAAEGMHERKDKNSEPAWL